MIAHKFKSGLGYKSISIALNILLSSFQPIIWKSEEYLRKHKHMKYHLNPQTG